MPPTRLQRWRYESEWRDVVDARRALGSLFVVTSDNPFSQVLSPDDERPYAVPTCDPCSARAMFSTSKRADTILVASGPTNTVWRWST